MCASRVRQLYHPCPGSCRTGRARHSRRPHGRVCERRIVMFASLLVVGAVIIVVLTASILAFASVRRIGPTEVGLATKRWSVRRLPDDNPIAFKGEAGYQADLLMPGVRWKLWLLYRVEKFPWVQVPAGEIGVVIAQVGEPLPIGAKSAIVQEGVRELLRSPRLHPERRAEGRAAAGAAAGHAGPDPSGRLPGDHEEPGLRPAGLPGVQAR